MRKLTLLVILFTISTFAQKDELKTLKKLYDITSAPSDKDIIKYNQAIATLEGMSNLDEIQKNEYNFYKGVQYILDIVKTVFNNPNNSEIASNLITHENINLAYSNFDKVKEYEKNVSTKIFTIEIDSKISPFLNIYIKNKAYSTYKSNNYNESSKLFHFLYRIDNKDILHLENAAQVSIEAKDYVEALKYYQELKNCEYLNSGKLYFAFNKITEKEDQFSTLEEWNIVIKMPNYEKPRTEYASVKKPLVYKNTAILLQENKLFDEAKKTYTEAKLLNPSDKELLNNEIGLYFNTKQFETYNKLVLEFLEIYPDDALMNFNAGEYFLIDDVKIVDELRANSSNDKKFNELSKLRKEMYEKALPFFEKAYSLDPKSVNNINFLKSTYNILGMTEKAAKL